MKLYSKEATAQSIATKLSKDGKQFEVQAHDGQFAVVEVGAAPVEDTLGDAAPMVSDDQPAIITGEDGEPVANPAIFPAAQSETDSTVTVHFPGARLTPNYVITQPMGKSKKGPVERWIERSRVKSATATMDGVTVTLSRKALKARGIDPEKYIVADATEATEAQTEIAA